MKIFSNFTGKHTRVTGRGTGSVYLALFKKLLKRYPDCGQLWVKSLIYNAIFESFQEKSWRLFLAGSFFLALYMIIYQSALIPKKIPTPKKFLATCLKHLCWSMFLITLLDWMLLYRIFFSVLSPFSPIFYYFFQAMRKGFSRVSMIQMIKSKQ